MREFYIFVNRILKKNLIFFGGTFEAEGAEWTKKGTAPFGRLQVCGIKLEKHFCLAQSFFK